MNELLLDNNTQESNTQEYNTQDSNTQDSNTQDSTEESLQKIELLEKEFLQLSSMLESFNEIIDKQQPILDDIQTHIQDSNNNTNKAVEHLEVADNINNITFITKFKVISCALITGALTGGVGVAIGGVSTAFITGGVGMSAGAIAGLFI